MLIWNLQFHYFLARYLTPSVCACIDTHLSLQSKRQGRKCRPVLRGMQHPMSDANMEKNGVSVKTKMHKWTKNVFNHLTSGPVCGAFCNTAQSCSIHKTTQIVVGLQQAGPSGTILFAKAALCEPVCMAVTTKKKSESRFSPWKINRKCTNSLQCNLQGWYLAQAISFISSLRTCHLSLSCDCAVLMKRILPANLDELQAHPSIPLKALAAPVWVELVTTDCLRTTCPKMRGNPLFQELKLKHLYGCRILQ